MDETAGSSAPRRDVGSLVLAADGGDAAARAELFEKLYRELHQLAQSQLRRMHPDLGVSTTTLLHDLYLDMSKGSAAFPDRSRFLAYAARAMRGIVIDAIRARRAEKRGGCFHITALTTRAGQAAAPASDHEDLAEALDRLERVDAPLAEIVNLNFFGGLTLAEIAALRGVTERTVQRDWQKARLFLKSALTES
jgi:RNA polymerase sigma factor (TIGR02999 family)